MHIISRKNLFKVGLNHEYHEGSQGKGKKMSHEKSKSATRDGLNDKDDEAGQVSPCVYTKKHEMRPP